MFLVICWCSTLVLEPEWLLKWNELLRISSQFQHSSNNNNHNLNNIKNSSNNNDDDDDDYYYYYQLLQEQQWHWRWQHLIIRSGWVLHWGTIDCFSVESSWEEQSRMKRLCFNVRKPLGPSLDYIFDWVETTNYSDIVIASLCHVFWRCSKQ